MTVKELKEKLGRLPDSAVVRFMTGSEDNPIQDYYDARLVYYLELVQETGAQAVLCISRRNGNGKEATLRDESTHSM